jgi:truncated hemoglobin YjbI
MEILKFKLLHFFKWQLDGAPHYIGKSMYEAHKDLGITDEVFDAASAVFTSQLRRIKPKIKVFREFVNRVGALRPEIVIPLPAGVHCRYGKRVDGECAAKIDEDTDIFSAFGEESGLRKLVTVVFEKAYEQHPQMFADWVVDKKTQIRMYTYFVAAMISEDFEWMSTSLEDSEADMKIQPQHFEDLIGLFAEACKELHISKPLTEVLLEKMHSHKWKICSPAKSYDKPKRQMTIV